ncbi:hypothetical protein PS645_03371 [Pseudomonas fluorescens]|uniref:Uncharacterized protein n=1 Tax=Pseudomonas fluorescens TaxID=294 RepID=A0A5E6UHH6_PSEFL|nr:hypothetical protein PS645_03371 [Pseudomonas fluorescens]
MVSDRPQCAAEILSYKFSKVLDASSVLQKKLGTTGIQPWSLFWHDGFDYRVPPTTDALQATHPLTDRKTENGQKNC